MNYLSKYLKYKKKYLQLKNNMVGGSNGTVETFESFLQSKGISNFIDLIPDKLSDMVNELLATRNSLYKNSKQKNLRWTSLIFINKKIFTNNSALKDIINTYFDTVDESASGVAAIEPIVTKAAGGVSVTTSAATSASAATVATSASAATATSAATSASTSAATVADASAATVVDADHTSFSAIPEIIIPSEELNYDNRDFDIFDFENFDFDNFDLSEMTASDHARTETDKIREYAFKMTALLFDKTINGYTLSALHYTSDDSDRENIIKILTKYYTKELDSYGENFLPERIDPYREKLRQVSLPTFLTTNKYMRVGCLKFHMLDKFTFYIDHIDAWIMEKGSGLQMICSLLKIFLPTFTTIMLTAETEVAKRYWQTLGFTVTGQELINTNIRETILSKCNPLASNVKLILKLNDTYTNDLEAVKDEIVS